MNFVNDRYQRRLEKRIAATGSFMSDTKWHKLFSTLSANNDFIKKCFIKNVASEFVREFEIPGLNKFNDTFFRPVKRLRLIETKVFSVLAEFRKRGRLQLLYSQAQTLDRACGSNETAARGRGIVVTREDTSDHKYASC